MLIKKNKIPFVQIIIFGIWPSFIKKFIYRLKGYKIGKNVSIGLGSVIIGNQVSVKDNTKIGMVSVIRGNDISIGRYVKIGSFTFIDCHKIDIGEDSRINENVIIGGIKTPDSSITLGKRTIIMEYSFINPSMPVIIGDDTGIGGHCLIFTHGSWLSQLDGYPVTFAPITLGKNVWLPWRIFILPGVTIGDNVVIGANSLVSKDLPENVLAAGSPAKIIRENFLQPPDDEKRKGILSNIFVEFEKHLRFYGYTVSKKEENYGFSYSLSLKNKKYQVLFLENNNSFKISTKDHIIILDSNFPVSKEPSGMVLNLLNKTRIGHSDVGEEFVHFISRFGIRFERLD